MSPASLVESFHKTQKKKDRSCSSHHLVIPPNQGAAITKHLDSEEWLYCRSVPTLRKGSKLDNPSTGAKAIARENRVGWPDISHLLVDNDIEGVSHLLASGQAKVNARNPRTGRALIHDAASQGYVEMVKMLIDRFQANTNRRTILASETALHLAVKGGHRHLVFTLLGRGANVQVVDSFGLTPMHYVDRKSIAQLLVEKGGSLRVRDYKGRVAAPYIEEEGGECYGNKKQLLFYLRKQANEEACAAFKDDLITNRNIAKQDKVTNAIIASIQKAKEKEAQSVLKRATKNYLIWRAGGKWNF